MKASSGAKGAALNKAVEETKNEEVKETSGIGGFRKVTDSISAIKEDSASIIGADKRILSGLNM